MDTRSCCVSPREMHDSSWVRLSPTDMTQTETYFTCIGRAQRTSSGPKTTILQQKTQTSERPRPIFYLPSTGRLPSAARLLPTEHHHVSSPRASHISTCAAPPLPFYLGTTPPSLPSIVKHGVSLSSSRIRWSRARRSPDPAAVGEEELGSAAAGSLSCSRPPPTPLSSAHLLVKRRPPPGQVPPPTSIPTSVAARLPPHLAIVGPTRRSVFHLRSRPERTLFYVSFRPIGKIGLLFGSFVGVSG